MISRNRSRLAAASAALLLSTSLAACGSGDSSSSSSPGTSAASSTAAGSAATSASDSGTPASTESASSGSTGRIGPVTITDGWAKATDMEMSAVFGTLVNNSDKAIHITGGSSDVAGSVETHEFVKDAGGNMVMQKAPNGFTIEAGKTFVLAPGANHIMLLGLKDKLVAGDSLTVTLETDLGQVPLSVMIRTFDGANETYNPSHSMSGSASMSMSSS
ncbi:copper chaperone PCu(A)C [Nostocoides australiense]|nr:copper chaperone PCu(A)C [Tetrasphaera australiensis]HRW02690.1 copper chaperone PCu(A)C [Tetrasphaera sp.]